MDNVNFVAIDFETANSKRSSSCSIGIAVVESGRIVKEYSTYIKPTPSHFDPINIGIHRIKPEMVAGAKPFDQLWPEIQNIIADKPIVAHNASFDLSVLRSSLLAYDLMFDVSEHYCTRNLSKEHYPGLINYKLSTVADELNIKLNHHEALSDATACAEVLIRICKDKSISSLKELGAKKENSKKKEKQDLFELFEESCVDTKSIIKTGDSINENHPFYDKLIVFTGALSTIPRKLAGEMVENIGGRWKDTLTKETNFLILGNIDFIKYGEGHKSNKLQKAEEYISKGLNLEIISEYDFMEMIDPLPNQTVEITIEKIYKDSDLLLKRNMYNELYDKLIYFSKELSNDRLLYFQEVGNRGGTGHDYLVDDIPLSDFLVVADRLISELDLSGDKHVCLVEFETIMRKAAINGTPKPTKLISESAFLEYIERCKGFSPENKSMIINEWELPDHLK